MIILKFMLAAIIIVSAIVSPTMIWDIVDIGAASLAIINVYAIFKLRKIMIEEYYNK